MKRILGGLLLLGLLAPGTAAAQSLLEVAVPTPFQTPALALGQR